MVTPSSAEPVTHPTRSRSTAGVRRDDILRAAAREFAQCGLAGTSTEVIAHRAGISQPYLFRLFGTKKALFLATVERGFDQVMNNFNEVATRAITDGGCAFEAMGARYVELLQDRDELLLQMQSYAACGDDDVRATVQRRYGELWTWLQSLPPCSQGVTVQSFMATGMLMNVAAAMHLPGLVDMEPWVMDCLTPEARSHGDAHAH